MGVTLRKPIVFQSNAHRFIAKDEAISVKHGGTGIVKVDEGELLLGSASADNLQALPAVATPGLRAYLSQILPTEETEPPSTSWRSVANLYTDIKPSIADDFIPYQNASKNVDLNKKDLVNVANLGIGTDSPISALHLIKDGIGRYLFLDRYIGTATGPVIRQRKARGSFLSPAAALNNDVAGGFIAELHDGSDFGQAAAMRIRATQNQSSGKHGAKIVFETVANDTTTLSERMVIMDDGKTGIGTTDPLDIFHVHNSANTAHVYFSSTRESAGAVATLNLMNIHTGSYTRFVHQLFGSPLREQSILTVYDADSSKFNQLMLFDYRDKSWTLADGVQDVFFMPSGNVGIGTSSPAKTLHVKGTMRVTDAAPVTELKGIVGLTTAGDLLTVTPTSHGNNPAYLCQTYDGEVYESQWRRIQGSDIEEAPWLPLAGGTMTGFITLHADPQNPLHAATKQYVDALSAGLVPFPPVHAVDASGNFNPSSHSAYTADGYELQNGDSLLVVRQVDLSENGIYVAQHNSITDTWTYSRRDDADDDGEMFKALIPVRYGDTFAGAMFYCTAPSNYRVGLDDIPFIQFLFPIGAKPGDGLVLNGNLIELGTPSTITHLTNNTVTAESHTHKLQLPTVAAGDMLIAGADNVLARLARGGEDGKYKFLRQTASGGEYATGWYEINAVQTKFSASGKILGRYSAGAGYAQEITVSTGISIAGGNLTNTLPMTYPGAGIAVSTGNAWATSIEDNSDNWNTAYGWGDHAGKYILKTILENPGDMIVAAVNGVPSKLARGAEADKYKFLRQTILEGVYVTGWYEINAVHTKFTTHNRILGRITEDGGYGEEIKIGTGLQISGTSLVNTAPMTYPASPGIAVAGTDSWETSIALSETQTDKYLNQDGTWQKPQSEMIYPAAGIPVSLGEENGWRATSIVLNTISQTKKFLNWDGAWYTVKEMDYPDAGIPISLETGWKSSSIAVASGPPTAYFLNENGTWQQIPSTDSLWNYNNSSQIIHPILQTFGGISLSPHLQVGTTEGYLPLNNYQHVRIYVAGQTVGGPQYPIIRSLKRDYESGEFRRIREGTELLNILAYGSNAYGAEYGAEEYGGGIRFVAAANWKQHMSGHGDEKPTRFEVLLGDYSSIYPKIAFQVGIGSTISYFDFSAPNVVIDDPDGAIYFGEKDAAGSWRIIKGDDKILFQKMIEDSYVTIESVEDPT